ncbi:NmrA family NAD(P)-binding protein [Streptomyces sp. MT29]|nr:NmrA family NAD(P)-binding protein [Streptomyces sp. MT29]
MTDQKIILVLGGTGNQGGATARELLSRGWSVRALVRDPDKPEAQALKELLGLPATILRPVFFMNNLLHFADVEGERVMSLPVKPDKPMQFIASDDIGVFAADAFDRPAEFTGREVELAGDEITFPQVAEVYERITGTPSRLEPTPIEERMFEWFAEEGYQADIPALRELHPGLLTFEQFLAQRLGTS